MSGLRARAQRLLAEEDPIEKPTPATKRRDPIFLWGKLILRSLVYLQTVRAEMIEEFLCGRDNNNNKPNNRQNNKNSNKIDSKPSQPWSPDQMNHFGIGNPLPTSTTRKFLVTLAKCLHPASQLIMRAGKGSYWWTCHDCGARWNRVALKSDESVCRVFVDKDAPLLWAKNGMATHLPTQLPPPKSQPHRATIEVEIVWRSAWSDFPEPTPEPTRTKAPSAPTTPGASSSSRSQERRRSASVRRQAPESVVKIEKESRRQMEVDARTVTIRSDDSDDFEEINPVSPLQASQ
jgi:hypothetical protein